MKYLNASIFVLLNACLFLVLSHSMPGNKTEIVAPASASIKNLSLRVLHVRDNSAAVTATFDVESVKEEGGEIAIIVDGSIKANNRIIIKKGLSHYTVGFLMTFPDDGKTGRLFTAAASLSVRGTTIDITEQSFGIIRPSLANAGGI